MRLIVDQIQHFIDDLKSPDLAIREAAAHALYDLGDDARQAVPSLYNALLRETGACPWVGTALTRLGPLAPDINALESALGNNNSSVRVWAARTAVRLGPAAEPLISCLIPLLCDPNPAVTDSVRWALDSIGSAAISPLIKVTRDHDAQLRAKAVLALGAYHKNAAVKLPAIISALDDPVANVRNHAARAVCGLAQDAHPDSSVYDPDTFAVLLIALDRISDDASIEVDAEWLDRLRRWHSPSA